MNRNVGGEFKMVRVQQDTRSEPKSFQHLVTFFKKQLT